MATYTGIKAILEQFKTRMIKTKVNNAVQADSATNATNATNADKLDGYHASNTAYPCLVPVTACSLEGTSGYIKLGNNLTLQWNSTAQIAKGEQYTFTYNLPIAMSNNNYLVLFNLYGDVSKDHTTEVSVSKTKTSVTFSGIYCRSSYGFAVIGN